MPKIQVLVRMQDGTAGRVAGQIINYKPPGGSFGPNVGPPLHKIFEIEVDDVEAWAAKYAGRHVPIDLEDPNSPSVRSEHRILVDQLPKTIKDEYVKPGAVTVTLNNLSSKMQNDRTDTTITDPS